MNKQNQHYYIIFDHYTDKLQAFQLVADPYSERDLTTPRIGMPSLQLGLELWQGSYQGIERLWLRWYDATGNWIPTPIEQENQQVDRLVAKVDKLAAKLRELGSDPNQI